MAKKFSAKKEPTKNKNRLQNRYTLKAFVASFFTIIGFIIALIIWRDEKYVMYYANHGLVLFLGQAIISLLTPLSPFIRFAWILWFILWILTWVNALSGKIKYTFIISDIAKKINL